MAAVKCFAVGCSLNRKYWKGLFWKKNLLTRTQPPGECGTECYVFKHRTMGFFLLFVPIQFTFSCLPNPPPQFDVNTLCAFLYLFLCHPFKVLLFLLTPSFQTLSSLSIIRWEK